MPISKTCSSSGTADDFFLQTNFDLFYASVHFRYKRNFPTFAGSSINARFSVHPHPAGQYSPSDCTASGLLSDVHITTNESHNRKLFGCTAKIFPLQSTQPPHLYSNFRFYHPSGIHRAPSSHGKISFFPFHLKSASYFFRNILCIHLMH